MNTKILFIILFIVLAQILAACGGPAAEPTSVPTLAPTVAPAPTATPEPASPTEVVQGFWNALNVQDVDEAMSFVAKDATCRGSCYFSGEQSFRSYLQGIVNLEVKGVTIEISNLQVAGGKVTYSWEYYRNGALQWSGTESMQVQDGKIVHWENLQN